MEQEEEDKLPAPIWSDVIGLVGTNFAELVEYRAKLNEALGKLEAAKAKNSAAISAHMQRCMLRSVLVGRLRATMSKGQVRKHLDPLKLMEKGVSSIVIKACTVETTGEPFPVITDTSKPRKKGRDAAA